MFASLHESFKFIQYPQHMYIWYDMHYHGVFLRYQLKSVSCLGLSQGLLCNILIYSWTKYLKVHKYDTFIVLKWIPYKCYWICAYVLILGYNVQLRFCVQFSMWFQDYFHSFYIWVNFINQPCSVKYDL